MTSELDHIVEAQAPVDSARPQASARAGGEVVAAMSDTYGVFCACGWGRVVPGPDPYPFNEAAAFHQFESGERHQPFYPHPVGASSIPMETPALSEVERRIGAAFLAGIRIGRRAEWEEIEKAFDQHRKTRGV